MVTEHELLKKVSTYLREIYSDIMMNDLDMQMDTEISPEYIADEIDTFLEKNSQQKKVLITFQEIAEIIDPLTFELIDYYSNLSPWDNLPIEERRKVTFRAYPNLKEAEDLAYQKANRIIEKFQN